MSTPAKNSVLRAILADDAAVKMVTALAAPGKTESKKIALTSGKMTTEQIVNRITFKCRNRYYLGKIEFFRVKFYQRQERGFFNAFIETLVMVLTKPGEAFTAMKREGGLGEPLIYALIGGCVGGLVSFLFSLGLQSFGFFADRHNTFAAMAGMGIGSVMFVVLIPLFIIIILFIGSAIVHLCLMIVGGANQSFETTFRVLAFSYGSTGPLQMIPICGGAIAGVWALVCNCIGLARAHETDTGRAVLAVLLPLIVCCGGGLLIAFMFGALGAWTASQH